MSNENPFHLSKIITPALTETIRAISDRAGQTEAQSKARAHDSLMLILSFQPRDAVETMLAGQVVVFNELLADSVHDVFLGLEEPAKARRLSTILGMGRLAQGYFDRLKARGNQPHRTEIEPARDAPPATPATPPPPPPPPPPPSPPVIEPQAAVTPEPRQEQPIYQDYVRPKAPETWDDEPCRQWLVDTPASLFAPREEDRPPTPPPPEPANGSRLQAAGD